MKQTLYQVQVLQQGKPTPVGPRMLKPMAEKFADTITAQIKKGAEKHWREPIVVPVTP